jgi:hypothetical protein
MKKLIEEEDMQDWRRRKIEKLIPENQIKIDEWAEELQKGQDQLDSDY